MSDEIAVTVSHVSKQFTLLHQQAGSVKNLFTGLTRRQTMVKETQQALADINFDIKKGEFFGIVGRNGSGKSTLLKILAGIYQPSKGEVSVVGKLVPFIELGVGFNPELTGRENVYLNGAMLGFSRSEIDGIYDDIVAFAELERFMDQKLKNYSSGMQVRLAFSMAVRAKADVLLIDEVLAVGDADFQRKCFEYFRQLKKDKITVVFVSHDMEAVREYCDRAVLIEKSAIIKQGKPEQIAKEYTKLFIENNESREGSTQDDRWGDGEIVTESITATATNKLITIKQVVKAQVDIESPVVGFRLRNGAGTALAGTNSKLEGKKVPSLKKGSSVTVTWRFTNSLSDGTYTIDPAVVHADGLTVSDWWDDAVQFDVKKSRHMPYPLDMQYELEVGDD